MKSSVRQYGGWQVEKYSEVLYRLASQGNVCGYVEKVGKVWVTLEGERLDRCVEVGQSLSLERAASLLSPAA